MPHVKLGVKLEHLMEDNIPLYYRNLKVKQTTTTKPEINSNIIHSTT